MSIIESVNFSLACLNQILMDMREIMDIVQWVIFTALGYYLFDRHLGDNMDRIEASVEREASERREDIYRMRTRGEEILDRVHSVEQIVLTIQKEEE